MSQIECTPWVRRVLKDYAGTRLATGYRLFGLAGSASGPWRLTLYRPGTPDETAASRAVGERVCRLATDVQPAFDSLVDLSWIDARERNCSICGQRPPELNVTFGDRLVGICETCYERGRGASGEQEPIPAG